MAKAIDVYTVDGVFVKRYPNTYAICRDRPEFTQCTIRHVLKGRRAEYKGHVFRYVEPKMPTPQNIIDNLLFD